MKIIDGFVNENGMRKSLISFVILGEADGDGFMNKTKEDGISFKMSSSTRESD